ncbi:PREDICTED: uncharacterized protein LOC108558704 [Nicrophorus vespilloides]|uniref:Uncharacterized protein LOC108558704 n=1 Tax=Nicrophorus vespilloides TaxID=110193 RepID=A0ABM1M9E2_NICVS|nr:PREDICTED: uncharacterized protein LOC108558704 [Nicrophorus vespilloides]
MTGFVFIVCVPNGDFEAKLKSKSHRRVFIKTTGKKRWSSSESIFKNKSSSDDEVIVESSPNRDNYQYVSMEKLVHDILVTYRMEKTAWSHNLDSNFVQMIFTIEAGDKCEEILEILKDHNVGLRYESTISIIPCSLYYQGCEKADETFTVDNQEEKKDVPDTAWTRFVSSVRARLTVAQIVEVLKSEAAVTFDFICLLVIATILCAIGLVENSNVYLLSSMLISPMMGPVMAGTFGSVIRDRMLQRIGVQSELIGLGTATLVGFCYGAIICMCTDKYGEVDWPTNEMISR